MLFGSKRIAVIAGFIVMSSLLIFMEYKYPFMIIGYSSNAERYIDIFIGLITIIIANTVVFVVIIKHYKKEHEKARNYLETKPRGKGGFVVLKLP